VPRARRGEAGVADEEARDLVVGHVVDWGRRQDQVGSGPSEEFDDAAARFVVIEDRQVAEFEALILGPDQGC
jgi:hypothetical protein